MPDEDIGIAITPGAALRGVDPLSLVGDSGTVFVVFDGAPGPTGFLWMVRAADFHFEAHGSAEYFALTRNGSTARVEAPAGTPFKHLMVAVTWAPESISVEVVARVEGPEPPGPNFRDRAEVATPATHVPNRIIGWLRRQVSTPTLTYPDEAAFRATVTWVLRFLQDILTSGGGQSVLWDIQREGAKIVSRRPKRETDCQAWANAVLFSVAAARNLTVAPGVAAAGGAMDFLITAPLANGATAKACVEFKLAHAADLAHGVTVQLPAYMRASACDFGVFLILNFSCAEFPDPADIVEVKMEVERVRMEAGHHSIHVVIIDCSLPLPPSKA